MSESNNPLSAIGEVKTKDVKSSDAMLNLPNSVQKAFSPKCKVCISRFCDYTNQQIGLGTTAVKISKRLAEMGEVVHPNTINNHKRKHMKDLDLIRQGYISKEDVDVAQTLKEQIHLTKFELDGSVDVAHRRFLMQRMDRLLKLLSEHETKLARSHLSPSVDRRSVHFTQVDARSTNQASPATLKPMLSLEEISDKLHDIHTAMEQGMLQVVDGDSGEVLSPTDLTKQILTDIPSKPRPK